MVEQQRNFWKAFGPGILFAGAAIGTSHLVQSTRAGAIFGLELLLVIVFANLIKYPIYRFGPLYASATGKSLLDGYRRLGKGVVALVCVLELPVEIIIIAATGLVTAGIGNYLLADLGFDVKVFAATLIVLAIAILILGGYRFLDRLTKVFVSILTVCTVVTTLLVISSVDWGIKQMLLPKIDFATFAFIIALMGFMPSAVNLSLIHSLWSVEKSKQNNHRPSKQQAMLDFNIGYVSSFVLAICFLLMGAGVMHSSGIMPVDNPSAFAGQVIALYSTHLGSWSSILVGISAFTVMFTTLIAALDGFGRVQSRSLSLLFHEVDRSNSTATNDDQFAARAHTVMIVLIGIFAGVILFKFLNSFKSFIDFVTIVSFVVGPVIATLNHIVMFGNDVSASFRPSKLMRVWSVLGILILSIFSLAYLYTNFIYSA